MHIPTFRQLGGRSALTVLLSIVLFATASLMPHSIWFGVTAAVAGGATIWVVTGARQYTLHKDVTTLHRQLWQHARSFKIREVSENVQRAVFVGCHHKGRRIIMLLANRAAFENMQPGSTRTITVSAYRICRSNGDVRVATDQLTLRREADGKFVPREIEIRKWRTVSSMEGEKRQRALDELRRTVEIISATRPRGTISSFWLQGTVRG